MKCFIVNRLIDVSGVSGIGIVAKGVVLESGRVVMEWLGKVQSIVLYNNEDELRSIVCHNEYSSIEFVCDCDIGNNSWCGYCV